jgi:hypothetical protein
MRDWLLLHWPGWKWTLTTIIAVYAAVLSTYRELTARRDQAHKVQIKLFTTMVIVRAPGQTEPAIQIRVENHGRTELTFQNNAISLQVKGVDQWFLLWDLAMTDVTDWPHRLEGGTSYYVMAFKAPLFALLHNHHLARVTARAVVIDAIGRQFFSAWVEVKQ